MKTILICGFEPFGGEQINPAQEAIKQISRLSFDGIRLLTCDVPVIRNKAIQTVIQAIQSEPVDAVLTLGQATGRSKITPERVAINVDDFPMNDNADNKIIDQPVIKDGPAAYFSTLPIKAIVNAMRDENIPAEVSNTAGTFLCNHLFYGVQHYLTKSDNQIKHGFIHLPMLPEQVTDNLQPSLQLDVMTRGLSLAIQVTAFSA